MIADKIVLEGVIDTISDDTVGRVLNKTQLKPYLKEEWCIPKGEDGAFVAAMEDVLDVYCQPYDANCPVICMDEKPYQMLKQVREPIPMTQNHPLREDGEYIRNGTYWKLTSPILLKSVL